MELGQEDIQRRQTARKSPKMDPDLNIKCKTHAKGENEREEAFGN